MKMKLAAGIAVAALAAGAVMAQVTLPQVQQIGATDLFQDIVAGTPTSNNQYATAAQMGTYGATLAGGNSDNGLIGGDFTNNLFSHGTSVGSVTTTPTYVANNWVAWSGTSTTIAGAQETAAADVPPNYGASLRITRSGAGVLLSCVAQEIETSFSYRYQGQPVEVDFHALAGSGFSAVGSNLQVSIATGTGTDEGATNLAHSFNASIGSAAWTGFAVTAANAVAVPLTTGWNRYTVAGTIPAAATEVAVVMCWKPVGASPSSDYFEFTGAQLVPNKALASQAVSGGAFIGANSTSAKAFNRRLQAQEVVAQERWVYSINELAAGVVQTTLGNTQGTTTTCTVGIPFPVTMRAAPTYTNGLSAATFKLVSASQAATALSTPFSATLVANGVNGASINFTTTGMTAKDGCFVVGAGGTGLMLWSAEL